MNRLVLDVVLLAGIYALTLASAQPLDLLTGALLATVVLFAFRRLLFARGRPAVARHLVRRLLATPAFALAVLRDVAAGTWMVGTIMLGVRPLPRTGVVAIPMGERTRSGVTVSALTATLSPGEVLVDLDWERREMLLHAIDAEDPDAVRTRYAHIYDRYQSRVFP